MESTPLKSVRPFVMDNVCLAKTRILTHDEDQVTAYLTEKVQLLTVLWSETVLLYQLHQSR